MSALSDVDTLRDAPEPGGAGCVTEISSEDELAALAARHSRVALNFWAPWAGPCAQMNGVFDALCASVDASPRAAIRFARVPAEALPAAAAAYGVATVPTFVLLHDGEAVARIEGADPPRLADRVTWLQTASADALADAALVETTKREEVMVFMKGTPDEPRCGFSRQIVDVLRKAGVVFGSFDILEDETVRAGLKKLHKWPTYPQLYARGRLVGGLDIVQQLAETGELIDELARDENDPRPERDPAEARRDKSHEQNGKPLEKSETTGGVGAASLPAGSASAFAAKPVDSPAGSPENDERLRELVSRSKIMLFMKGAPEAPQCGFSRRIVALLKEQDITFDSFDILEDQSVRQGLKKLFDWPTFPQLYADGNLVGGLDIVQDLVQAGSLREELGL